MVERRHDVPVRSQKLGEPGIVETVAAAPVGENDERTLLTVGCFGILVKIELGEERQHKRRGEALADRGGIEHPQRQMAAALVRVDVVELPDPDRKGGGALQALRERCSGKSRQQCAGKCRAARGARPPADGREKFPDQARHIVIAHAQVLSSIGRERKAAGADVWTTRTVLRRCLPRLQPNSGLPEFGSFIDWPKPETFGWRDREGAGKSTHNMIERFKSPPPSRAGREQTEFVARADSI